MKKIKPGPDKIPAFHNRHYSIKEQKAELLWRNKEFQKDLKRVRIHFKYKRKADVIAAAADHKKVNELTEVEIHLPLRQKTVGNNWFYDKWDLNKGWDGQKKALCKNIHAGARLWYFETPDPRENLFLFGRPPKEFTRYQEALPLRGPAIFITADPWTTKKQISNLCRFLPRKKAEVFGFAVESKRFFARDLYWYDLRHNLKLSFSKIARIWVQKEPNEFNGQIQRTQNWKDMSSQYSENAIKDTYSSFPQVVRAAINRLQKAIDYLSKSPPWPPGYEPTDII